MKARKTDDVINTLREFEREGTMGWEFVRKQYLRAVWVLFMLFVVVTLLVGIYAVAQRPSFEQVMEAVRAFGELYLWPLVILALVGWVFREPVSRLLDRIKGFSTPIGSAELSPSDLPSIPAKGTLDINYPGNLFWLAHNIEHTRLRLVLMWPKSEVIAMLENCIYHARKVNIPGEHVRWLVAMRETIAENPSTEIRWKEHAQELEKFFQRIAGVAENSHPAGHDYVPAPPQ